MPIETILVTLESEVTYKVTMPTVATEPSRNPDNVLPAAPNSLPYENVSLDFPQHIFNHQKTSEDLEQQNTHRTLQDRQDTHIERLEVNLEHHTNSTRSRRGDKNLNSDSRSRRSG